jgi:hypothetical protein
MGSTPTRADQLDQLMWQIHATGSAISGATFRAVTALVEDAKLEQDIEALTTAQRGLQHVYAKLAEHEGGTFHEGVLRGRTSQLLEAVSWYLQRNAATLSVKPVELTEDQRKVLAVFEDSEVQRTMHQVMMTVNAASSIGPSHTREVLESLVALGLVEGQFHGLLRLYGPKQEQPARA